MQRPMQHVAQQRMQGHPCAPTARPHARRGRAQGSAEADKARQRGASSGDAVGGGPRGGGSCMGAVGRVPRAVAHEGTRVYGANRVEAAQDCPPAQGEAHMSGLGAGLGAGPGGEKEEGPLHAFFSPIPFFSLSLRACLGMCGLQMVQTKCR
eukprot:365122-Chlamydomonas_euryale.AAC.34